MHNLPNTHQSLQPLSGWIFINFLIKGLKLKQGRFRSAIKKNFLTALVAKLWNRLPRELVRSLSWEVQCNLDKTISRMV